MSDSIKLLPETELEMPALAPTWRISMSHFLYLGFGALPLALTWCIIETILTDYWASTYTHCEVLNVLPSVSSAARHNELLWLMVTLEFLMCRVIVAWFYARFYRHLVPSSLPQLGAICLTLLLLEGISTVVMALSMKSSGGSSLHVLTVLSIWCSQTGYMTAFNYCYARYPSYALEPHQLRSYRLKRKLLRLILACFVGMIIFYLLHNEYCLPLGELVECILSFHCWSAYSLLRLLVLRVHRQLFGHVLHMELASGFLLAILVLECQEGILFTEPNQMNTLFIYTKLRFVNAH